MVRRAEPSHEEGPMKIQIGQIFRVPPSRQGQPCKGRSIKGDNLVADRTDLIPDSPRWARQRWYTERYAGQSRFKLVETVLSPVEYANIFESTVKPAMGRILSNLLESRPVAAQRDASLPMLVSGEVGGGAMKWTST